MKKISIASSIITLSLLTACQYGAEEDIYKESGNTINVQNRHELYSKNDNLNDKKDDFGYVRHQKSGVPQDNTFAKVHTINREQLANTISSICVQMPGINDVATLVTDDEVLVGYQTNAKDRNAVADQVKRSAASAVPRYYKVYVSDNKAMMEQIESFSPLSSTSRNVDEILNKTIREMLKSPQGKKMNSGENANGEAYGEMNEKLDTDMKDNYDKKRYE
ncbi:YhcN/YlaJ family sporulation lipoprotein [Metabacillus fastidiosus]|uniref:YhcN/YlaJ family sporulation lipoprotein n=1 Tax=Metabacillus fastidiosus TaxID=1458 RepID=A0ABU6P0X3_9BACI|nr:YhcN/YlaJ family sporulation lipoprotein [Metabacillus fastidiosus]MED4402981.1 YhcN/YlaJ family sporulation lipoprotein [Metabacillus fastidiosus]MED4461399.1 YhcN/YlaJ family sporulation lipoprotein [Metabacillus fastidiosus]